MSLLRPGTAQQHKTETWKLAFNPKRLTFCFYLCSASTTVHIVDSLSPKVDISPFTATVASAALQLY